jgi:hypothetical protein
MDDDLLNFDVLTRDVEHAPTEWLRSMIERLEMIGRADVLVGAEAWKLAAIHDDAKRTLDVLLAELGRRLAGEEA